TAVTKDDGPPKEARGGLFAARLARARASRKSGQRFESLQAVKEAMAIARELRMPAARFDDLRTEAIAALALPDLEVAREWDGWPEGTAGPGFDDFLARYRPPDRRRGLAVRPPAPPRGGGLAPPPRRRPHPVPRRRRR